MRRLAAEIVLVLALMLAGVWIWKLTHRKVQPPKIIGRELTTYKHDTVTVTKWKDADSAFHATVQQLKSESVKKVLPKDEQKDFQESTLKALQVGAGAVTELKKLDLVSSGQLKSANVQVAPNKIVTITYSNGYLTFKSKVDSTGKPIEAVYTYNNKIQATDITKKKVLFFNQKPEDYTDIKSADPNSSIDNLAVYQFPAHQKRDWLQLIWENNALISTHHDRSFDELNSGILMIVNPQGFISPSAGIGGQWQFNSGLVVPYVKAGINVNLIRFKR